MASSVKIFSRNTAAYNRLTDEQKKIEDRFMDSVEKETEELLNYEQGLYDSDPFKKKQAERLIERNGDIMEQLKRSIKNSDNFL